MRRIHTETHIAWEDDVYVNGMILRPIARFRHLELQADGDVTVLDPGVPRLNVEISNQL